jgi:lipopolysaccharide biosynthesis regulator YciM
MEDAASAYLAELAIDPRNPSTLFKLGSLQVMHAHPEEGVVNLKKALQLDPTILDATYYLGRGELMMGDNQSALVQLRHVAESGSDDPVVAMAWYQLSHLYRHLGQLGDGAFALQQFRNARDGENARDMSMRMVKPDRRRQLPRPPLSPMQAP